MIKYATCFLALWCCGCAALGTKSNFMPHPPDEKITQVVLTTTAVNLPMGMDPAQVDSVFVKELVRQLAASTGWRVRYVGEVGAFMQAASSSTSATREAQPYQAVVHAELNLKYYGDMRGEPRFNAWARMQAFKFPEKRLLGKSRFNTLMGHSYGLDPNLENAIRDGVTGLVSPWRKQFGGTASAK